MNSRIVAVVRKEVQQYRRNRGIVFSMAGLPVLFLLLLGAQTLNLPTVLPEKLLRAVVGQEMLFFLIIPIILPSTIAAYSVIGEREQGALEPVLTTPVTDRELLAGKAIAAVVPAVLIAWLLFVAYVGLVRLAAAAVIGDAVLTPETVVAQLLLVPTLSGFAIVVGILVSLRTTDVRVAQQLAGLASLPVMLLVAAASFGIIEPSVKLFVVLAMVVAAVDAAGWRLVVRLFNAERLLTRYGA
jgi:ABC-2 type transport system permease protein